MSENQVRPQNEAASPSDAAAGRQNGAEGVSCARQKPRRALYWAAGALGLIFVVSAALLIKDIAGYAAGRSDYSELSDAAVCSDAAPREAKWDYLAPDFGYLRSVNGDFWRWLQLPGSSISYPVVTAKDNDHYLTHTYSGKSNGAGALFVDSREDADADNTVVYGHRMNDGSMFGRLYRLRDQDYFDGHSRLLLYDEQGVHVCAVFAVYLAEVDSDTYTFRFADAEAERAYIADARSRSEVSCEVELTGAEKLVTLSTCIRGDYDRRLVVQAAEVQLVEYPEWLY